MRKRLCSWVVSVGVATGTVGAAAQEAPFHYPRPRPEAVSATWDVPYAVAHGDTLAMDVLRPTSSPAPATALVFFNVAAGAERRSWTFYTRWAETAAAHGLVGIVPDLRSDDPAADFRGLMAHLHDHASMYGIDPERIAVYAASGNAYTALPVLEDPAMTSVAAAVIYYGAAPVQAFRLDLPLLLVRAGLDRPAMGEIIDGLIAQASRDNAPVTLLNDAGGYHAFEMRNDDAVTRDVMERTLDFVVRSTSPAYRAALRASLPSAAAAGHVANGRFAEAAAIYEDLRRAAPGDATLGLALGEALTGAGDFGRACAVFDDLRGARLGPRDLGLPAARACLANGDRRAALDWLRSIPTRFLPASLRTDDAFAALRDDPEFQALFR